MATINFLKRKDSKNSGALGSVIAYCTQRYKTEIEDTNVRLISGVNCIAERAFKDFMDTKSNLTRQTVFSSTMPYNPLKKKLT